MRSSVALGAAILLAACAAGPVMETAEPAANAWYGLKPAKYLSDPQVAPRVAERAFIPKAAVIASDPVEPYFEGARIRSAVETVIGFAQKMRAEGNQMWGRISGFPSETRTAEWLADEFRAVRVQNVEVQTYKATGEFWWPSKWDVSVINDLAYGAGGAPSVTLVSAVPVSRSFITGEINAGVVFAGEAGAVSTQGVAGKIAIQHTRPTTGAYSDRAKVRDSATALINAGAVAVLNWIEQSGNMHVFDFGGCGGPCFNIGGADGTFLTGLIAKAKAAGAPEVKMRLTLDAAMKTGLEAQNVIGMVRGVNNDEIVVVNAHLDSWFDGAGDNADGVGVLLALAKHFSKPGNRLERTLVFVGSGGHHSAGMNGPGNLVTMNGPLLKKAVAVINLEHLAQFDIDAVPEWKPNVTEEPKNFGISNSSPFLVEAVKTGAAKYGFVIQPEIVNTVPGDLGGYAPLGVARLQGIHSGPLYHTSGDVLGSISNEGLTRAARFYADLIRTIAKAPAKSINP